MKTSLLALALCVGLVSLFPTSTAQSFQIYSYALGDPMCLTIPASNNNPSVQFTMAACYSEPYQYFAPGATSTHLTSYRTRNSASCATQCLDIPSGTGNSVRVQTASCNPSKLSQYWTLTTGVNQFLSTYGTLKNVASLRCMTFEGSPLTSTYVDQQDCATNPNTATGLRQLWRPSAPDANTGVSAVTIATATGQCLEVTDGSPNAGAGLDTATCAAKAYYQHFVPVTLSAVSLSVTGSGLCVDGGSGSGTAVQNTCSAAAKSQQWLKTTFPDEGTVPYGYWIDVLSGLCLTWDSANLSNVHMTTCTQGNVYQQFY